MTEGHPENWENTLLCASEGSVGKISNWARELSADACSACGWHDHLIGWPRDRKQKEEPGAPAQRSAPLPEQTAVKGHQTPGYLAFEHCLPSGAFDLELGPCCWPDSCSETSEKLPVSWISILQTVI